MSCRGKAHSGTSAIAVASLLCGLRAATLPLAAQPFFSLPAEQLAAPGPVPDFEERFSLDPRRAPFFTQPGIQELLAALPSSSEEVLVAGVEPEPAEPASEEPENPPAEPQPAENTASVLVQPPEPGPETASATPVPPLDEPLPELPPPPPPADIVLPPPEEFTAATPSEPLPSSAVPVPEASGPEAAGQAEISSPPPLPAQAVKKTPPRNTTRLKKQAAAPDQPAATGTVSSCPAGTACASQPQPFAIFFGFIAGGLLGGPLGAIAGGMAGALLASPKASPGKSASAAQKR